MQVFPSPSRVDAILFLVALMVVPWASAQKAPPDRFDTPDKLFPALQSAVRTQDLQAFKKLHHSTTDDYVRWLLERPNKLPPGLLDGFNDEFFLAGREDIRDRFATWLAPQGKTLESAVVDDYYLWLLRASNRPDFTDPQTRVRSIKPGITNTHALIDTARNGILMTTFDACREGGEWRVNGMGSLGACGVLANPRQRERGKAKKRHPSPAPPSPSASPSK